MQVKIFKETENNFSSKGRKNRGNQENDSKRRGQIVIENMPLELQRSGGLNSDNRKSV